MISPRAVDERITPVYERTGSPTSLNFVPQAPRLIKLRAYVFASCVHACSLALSGLFVYPLPVADRLSSLGWWTFLAAFAWPRHIACLAGSKHRGARGTSGHSAGVRAAKFVADQNYALRALQRAVDTKSPLAVAAGYPRLADAARIGRSFVS